MFDAAVQVSPFPLLSWIHLVHLSMFADVLELCSRALAPAPRAGRIKEAPECWVVRWWEFGVLASVPVAQGVADSTFEQDNPSRAGIDLAKWSMQHAYLYDVCPQ